MKQCITTENRFDFLRELVKNIPDINVNEDLSSECASPGSPNQLEINLQPQDEISSSSSSTAAAFKPNNNNNTNGSNLVRNGHRGMLHSKSVDLPHQQQQNWDSSMYATNRPFNNLGSLPEERTTSQATTGPNFYTEISDPSVIQYSKSVDPDFCIKPPKLSRLDSAPSIMSSSSHSKNKNLELLLSTPLNLTKTATTTYNDFTTKLCGKANKRKTDPPPLLAPIIKSTNLRNNSIDFSVPSTSKNIPSPPVIKLDICNSPVVKIDYSNLALSPTFGHNNILPSPSVVVNTGITNSTYNQSPIINIDFSNLNSFNFNNTKPTAVINQQMPSSTQSNSVLEMDEDYDNI